MKKEVIIKESINDLYNFEEDLCRDERDEENCKDYLREIENKINSLIHDSIYVG